MFDLDNDNEEDLLEENNHDIDTNNKIINDTGTDINNNTIFSLNNSSRTSLVNTKEDFSIISDASDIFKSELKDFLKKNNLCMITYPKISQKSILNKKKGKNKIINFTPIQKIKFALLKKEDNPRVKDFNFKFQEEQDYYFLITKELNPNYTKPITTAANKRKKIGKDRNESKDSELNDANKNESKKINLNFDYNKYILKALIVQEKIGKIEIVHQEILNREVCQVSHTTKDSLAYYKNSKKIKKKDEEINFRQFVDLTPEKYYLIEVEQKKPAGETIIKSDGILSVLYLITSEKKTAMNIYTMVKYALYFIDETLINYIGKYIHDMIYDFCHLPSECFDDFLSHIGSIKKEYGNNYKLVFPLKKYIKDIDDLSKKCLVSHVYRNLPNISRPKAADKIPFHKFIFLYEKYKLYYEEKEFKIKQKYFKKYKKKYDFLKQCLIDDPINDKISKENKINLNEVLKLYFEILEKYLRENLSNYEDKIKDFLIPSLAKFLSHYSALKGFINIDIVMNEDNRFEFQCSHNKACNKCINNKMFSCVVNTLRCINWIFDFNEGFFHKHFSIMDYSYNFNEKNVIHTFLCINDSSKKNTVRIFDIPFMDRWCYHIASLLFVIYRDSFGFLVNKSNLSSQKTDIDYHDNFSKLFAEVHNTITEELFENYQKVIPNFFEFCYKTSETPLDKYNCLDNLCQNFTNKSIEYLLKNNIIFFTTYEVVFQKELGEINQNLKNPPILDAIYEPYLILVDKTLTNYLNYKEKKEEYLKKENIDKKEFFNRLKNINIEKPHYTVFLLDQKGKETEKEKETELEDEDDTNDNEINTSENQETDKEIIPKSESEITTPEVQNEEKNTDINILNKKKMYKTNIIKSNPDKIVSEGCEFYFLLNLYYNFTYDTMKELKQSFVDYDTLKRYIASIESSVTVSFNEFDKTIMNKVKGKDDKDNSKAAKDLKKGVKKDIINNLIIMAKLTRMTRHMSGIFIQYMKKVINAIINKNSAIKKKIGNDGIINDIKGGSDYFMKIGHYMVNFKAYKNNQDSYESFKKSKFYEKIEKEDSSLSLEIQNQIIIDK